MRSWIARIIGNKANFEINLNTYTIEEINDISFALEELCVLSELMDRFVYKDELLQLFGLCIGGDFLSLALYWGESLFLDNFITLRFPLSLS